LVRTKSENRILNFEIRNKSEYQETKFKTADVSAWIIRISEFEFVSNFEIGISDFLRTARKNCNERL